MSESKKWFVYRDESGSPTNMICEEIDQIIGNGPLAAEATNIEDAHLIAAAPQMLEALESMERSLDWIIDQATPDQEMVDLLRADHGKIKSAIAKAKGGNS
jgi:hypothetical protein